MFRGIKDTTTSAWKTGELVSMGRVPNVKGTTCHMHTQELVVKHALGIATRSVRGKGVVDSFAEGLQLKKKKNGQESKSKMERVSIHL